MSSATWHPSTGEWGIFGTAKGSNARADYEEWGTHDRGEQRRKEGLSSTLGDTLGMMKSNAADMLGAGGYFQRERDTQLTLEGANVRDTSNKLRRQSEATISKGGFAGTTNAQTDYEKKQNISMSNVKTDKLMRDADKTRKEYLTNIQNQAQNMMTSYTQATELEYGGQDDWESFTNQYT